MRSPGSTDTHHAIHDREASTPPPDSSLNTYSDAYPDAYQPPRVTPIGTLPESTGMQVSSFQLGDEPVR
jgi:hypothetical protein